MPRTYQDEEVSTFLQAVDDLTESGTVDWATGTLNALASTAKSANRVLPSAWVVVNHFQQLRDEELSERERDQAVLPTERLQGSRRYEGFMRRGDDA